MASTPDAGAEDAGGVPGGDGYEVLAVRREGWAGTIRDGVYRPTGRRVAIQDIRADLAATSDLLARLADAGRAIASVRDPHLVAVFDLMVAGGEVHLVTEWSDAPSLATSSRERRLSGLQALHIVDDVLGGLEVLYTAGVSHGHVDEETVVVEADGTARLAELAIAAAAAPAEAGIREDVRAAAAMGVRLLTALGDEADGARQVLAAAAAPNSSLGPAELRVQLSAATVPPPRRRRRRGALLATALVLVLVAGGGAAYLLLGRSNRAADPSASAPLVVGADAAVTVTPPRGGCNTTFAFVGRGSLTGSGVLAYRWELSDGQSSGDTALTITSHDGAFLLTNAWRLQGSQTVDGTAALHILKPLDRRISSPSFHYACP